jgi:hypothetical protein
MIKARHCEGNARSNPENNPENTGLLRRRLAMTAKKIKNQKSKFTKQPYNGKQ